MASMIEKRKYQRIGYDMPVRYSLFVHDMKDIKKVDSSASTVDISEEGIGFYTDYPLEPGHILRLRMDRESEQTAMVRWVDQGEKKYRVGVLFY